MIKNLLYISKEDKKALTEMGYKEIEKVSRYCNLSQKLFNVFLVAYEQGIKELNSDQVAIIWYKLYGNKLQTVRQIQSRLYNLGYSPYLNTRIKNKDSLYSLVEDKIDELKYELSLKSSEHKKYRVTPTPEMIEAKFIKEIKERLSTKEVEEILNKIKTMTREQILHLNIVDLPFTYRVKHGLINESLKTIEDLLNYRSKHKLLITPNFGPKSVKEIEYILNLLGLTLKTN